MHKLVSVLVPVALFGGAAVGYFARSAHTKTVTVVQIETTQPPPPATHKLVAVVQAKNGSCLSSDAATYSDILQHTFVLRRPGNGVSNGDVVAVAQNLAFDNRDCNLDVTFKISPKLGFFVVDDEEGSGGAWGPFDSHQLAAQGWTLILNET